MDCKFARALSFSMKTFLTVFLIFSQEFQFWNKIHGQISVIVTFVEITKNL